MTQTLPIRRIILYKHGVAYFERRGQVQGEMLNLSFPRLAMDDVLKSLTALDLGSGQVLSLDFETPEDRAELLAKGSIHLSDTHTLLDLLRDLRGRQVRCFLSYDPFVNEEEPVLEGMVVGVDYGGDDPLPRAMLSIYQHDHRTVEPVALTEITRLELLDETSAADLSYFLRATRSEEDRRSATLHLSPGEHDLLVGYIAPAPAWRVSYRLLVEQEEETCMVLFQGWGLFDNQLEEDLEKVKLTLVAGMPVSFRYRLYEPRTPERPLVEDEERTVSAPIFFEGAQPPAPPAEQRSRKPARRKAMAERSAAGEEFAMSLGLADMEVEEATMEPMAADYAPALSIDDMQQSVTSVASGGERGALFAYEVEHPISVARGQSAMVPILSQRVACHRDLLYNGSKLPMHPVVSLRMTNETDLTLERGPVTVLEDGDYAGEAVVPFTRAGGEVIVPYAVELGIKVREERGHEQRLVSLWVRGEYLQYQEYDHVHTIYHLNSTLSSATEVVIEHTPLQEYELTDTREPDERSDPFLRWNVACAANAQTTFTVSERKMMHRHEQIRSLSTKRLQSYLRDKFLDETTVAQLQAVLQVYDQIARAHKHVQQIEKERNEIYRKQKQIQGNLGPLDSKGEEGALRKRYVTELNGLEDRLLKLAEDEHHQQAKITAWEQEIQQKLKELEQTEKS